MKISGFIKKATILQIFALRGMRSHLSAVLVEIFDDGWNYWVQIDEKERKMILQLDINDYPKGKLIKLIETKQKVICKRPSDASPFGNKENYIRNIELIAGSAC